MNDVTIEIQGDTLDKPEKKRKWDKSKKRYVNVFVDPEGHEIKEKPNNKTVKKLKDKYNKWIKKTHVRIQSAGEIEDEKIVENAKSASYARKEFKNKKSNHEYVPRRPGRDLRTPEQVLKQKKKEFRKKKGRFNPERKFEKGKKKMEIRSAPRRSKMIIKHH